MQANYSYFIRIRTLQCLQSQLGWTLGAAVHPYNHLQCWWKRDIH